ncbi:hypothetical protein PSTT_16854, partial [Puccinia striiformis]
SPNGREEVRNRKFRPSASKTVQKTYGLQETNDRRQIEIMDFQEREIEEKDLANNIVQLIQASLDDGTSDEDELSGSDLDGEEETLNHCGQNLTGTNQTSVELRLSHYSALYHSGPNRQPMMINIQEQALARWNKLNHAINFVMAEYKKKLKKNPQFKYDSATIANLMNTMSCGASSPSNTSKALSNAA